MNLIVFLEYSSNCAGREALTVLRRLSSLIFPHYHWCPHKVVPLTARHYPRSRTLNSAALWCGILRRKSICSECRGETGSELAVSSQLRFAQPEGGAPCCRPHGNVQSICVGKQAPTLIAERLKARAKIPIDRTEQDYLLSI